MNFEAFNLMVNMLNLDEIHNVVSSSYLANIHVLLASARIKKVVFYFQEPSEFLSNLARDTAKELDFIYEEKII